MNEDAMNHYNETANTIEINLREQGYLAPDILAVAYWLLKNNLDATEKIYGHERKTNRLLERAEVLLKDL